METPYQLKTPIRAKLNQVQEKLLSQEVKEMLEKGAIREAIHCKDQFVSHPLLVLKKDGGQRPMINLNELNTLIPYKHFKMEGLHLLKEMLEQGDYLCKLGLKDAYFCVPLNKVKKICTFRMGGFPVRIPSSMFWARSSPKAGCWGAFCQKTSIGGVWSQAEQALHINIPELRAAKFAMLTFCRYKKDLAVQMDNQSALAYLVKSGRDKKPTHDSGSKGNFV